MPFQRSKMYSFNAKKYWLSFQWTQGLWRPIMVKGSTLGIWGAIWPISQSLREPIFGISKTWHVATFPRQEFRFTFGDAGLFEPSGKTDVWGRLRSRGTSLQWLYAYGDIQQQPSAESTGRTWRPRLYSCPRLILWWGLPFKGLRTYFQEE